jgi:hypothetical protein
VSLFKLSIARTEASPNQTDHLDALRENFTYTLYENVCRSLFEKDKLLFSLQLCTQIMIGDGSLSRPLLRVLLQGTSALELSEPNPAGIAHNNNTDAQTGDELASTQTSSEGGAAEDQVQPEHAWFTDQIWANVLGLCEILSGQEADNAQGTYG